jgi:hypothetical protein
MDIKEIGCEVWTGFTQLAVVITVMNLQVP